MDRGKYEAAEDPQRTHLLNVDITTTPKNLMDISYPKARVTLMVEQPHRTDRRIIIGHREDISFSSGIGCEIFTEKPHVIYEDPSQLWIVADNDCKISVQVELQ